LLALNIARRYLIAKKSHQAINIISLVTVAGLSIGTMGLIIVLSVFNGFGDLVLSLYNTFDPDIKITAIQGKTFNPSVIDTSAIYKVKGVKSINYSLQENALVRYRDRQYIVTIKGVTENFLQSVNFSNKIVEGNYLLQQGDTSYAMVGGQIAYSLGINAGDPLHFLNIYIPKRNVDLNLVFNPDDAFNSSYIYPSAVFSIQQDFDSKFIIVPLQWAREVIGHEKNISAIEIILHANSVNEKALNEISKIAGSQFKVEDRLQQHDFLYKILKSEKLAVFIILTFILLIAAFNVIGSLTILVIEKKNDINILQSMGATFSTIRNIFLLEGLLITLSGAVTGLLLGGLICFVQQTFGIIKLEDAESFVIDAYPVIMKAGDFINIFLTVVVIGAVASLYTSRQMVKKQINNKDIV